MTAKLRFEEKKNTRHLWYHRQHADEGKKSFPVNELLIVMCLSLIQVRSNTYISLFFYHNWNNMRPLSVIQYISVSTQYTFFVFCLSKFKTPTLYRVV